MSGDAVREALAAIGEVVFRFIDRMNDVDDEHDPADRILREFVAAVMPAVMAAGEANRAVLATPQAAPADAPPIVCACGGIDVVAGTNATPHAPGCRWHGVPGVDVGAHAAPVVQEPVAWASPEAVRKLRERTVALVLSVVPASAGVYVGTEQVRDHDVPLYAHPPVTTDGGKAP